MVRLAPAKFFGATLLAISVNLPNQLYHPALFRALAIRSPLLLTALGSFLVYLFTLAATVYGLDSAKFSAVFRRWALGGKRSNRCFLEL